MFYQYNTNNLFSNTKRIILTVFSIHFNGNLGSELKPQRILVVVFEVEYMLSNVFYSIRIDIIEKLSQGCDEVALLYYTGKINIKNLTFIAAKSHFEILTIFFVLVIPALKSLE